jgi:hypothetical protein
MLDLGVALARLRRSSMAGGVLVLVTGVPDDPAIGVYRTLGNDFYRTIVLSSAPGADEGLAPFERVGATTVCAAAPDRWAPAWKQGMERSWSTATAG